MHFSYSGDVNNGFRAEANGTFGFPGMNIHIPGMVPVKRYLSGETMYWRPISESDLSECLDIQPACLGDQIVGRRTALGVWQSLLDHPSFQANVIESDRAIAGHKILACG